MRQRVSERVQDVQSKILVCESLLDRLRDEIPQTHDIVYSSLPGSRSGTEQRVHMSGHSDATAGNAMKNPAIRKHYRRAIVIINSVESRLKEALEELAKAVDAADKQAEERDPQPYLGRHDKPPLLGDEEQEAVDEENRRRRVRRGAA